jgi:ribosomal-protein-alanine N-acetyltransferase
VVETPVVMTERLRLRGFHAEDLPAHRAAVDDDAAVTWAHVRLPLAESLRRWADRLDGWERDGFGMWIVELGYYLGRPAWGQGYATEAARACLRYGFETCRLPRVVAVVRTENQASRHVLEKLGLRHDRDGVFYEAEASLMVIDRP